MARWAMAAIVVALIVAPAARAQSPGGHLDVLSVSDVDSLDPGYWHDQYDYMALSQTTQRWLYAWEPGKITPTPDVAPAMPVSSHDGKTVPITIRPGIRYSAPLSGRAVTAPDV